MRTPLRDAARGRWRDILMTLGIASSYLTGKHGPCPICEAGKDRFRFDDKEGRGTWFCSSCGAGDGIALVQNLRGVDFRGAAEIIEPLVGSATYREVEPETSDDQKRQWMRELWNGAVRIDGGDPAGMWLRMRTGIDAFPSALRFHDSVAYRDADGERSFAPGMLARVTDRDGMPINIHRTYLTYRGEKAAVAKPRAMMPGTTPPGSAVRLYAAGEALGIAEGIETAIAAHVLHDLPVWAALNAGLMSKWDPPPGVKQVVVFGDNDPTYVGQAAAFQLAHRLARERKVEVDVRIPSESSFDWNRVLQAQRQPVHFVEGAA